MAFVVDYFNWLYTPYLYIHVCHQTRSNSNNINKKRSNFVECRNPMQTLSEAPFFACCLRETKSLIARFFFVAFLTKILSQAWNKQKMKKKGIKRKITNCGTCFGIRREISRCMLHNFHFLLSFYHINIQHKKWLKNVVVLEMSTVIRKARAGGEVKRRRGRVSTTSKMDGMGLLGKITELNSIIIIIWQFDNSSKINYLPKKN